MHRPAGRTTFAATALLAATTALSGCSMLGGSAADATASATASRLAHDGVNYPPVGDAKLGSCKGAAGIWTASGTVVNPTKTTYTYTVTVEFYDAAGQQVDESVAAPLPALATLKSATWTATSNGAFPNVTTCRIGAVDRSLP